MPWTGSSFAKHNHSLSSAQSAHAAKIANHVLQSTGDEGESIATANKLARRATGGIVGYDMGGTIDPSASGIPAVTPTAQTMNPLAQNALQRYSSMSPEQLQQLAIRLGPTQQGQMVQHILAQKRVMNTQPGQQQQPQVQPIGQPMGGIAPQPQMARGGELEHRAMGGMSGMSLSQMDPWWTRREASAGESGFLHSAVPGRTDQISASPPAGSYVIPADVVSGLGEGNSLAGARVMDEVLSTGPHGIQEPRMGRGAGPPHPPTGRSLPQYGASKGGRADGKRVPCVLAGGEYVVHPEQVAYLGAGDLKRGHDLLDEFVKHVRGKTVKTLQKLPGPVGAKK